MASTAKLSIDGKTYELPIVEGTEGERAIDITNLRSTTGLITLDDGYGNTGSCKSDITFIDGEKGILRYRGYPIEQLVERSSFLEVSFLLIYGELPTEQDLENWRYTLTRHTLLHEDMKLFFEAFPIESHPMAILSAMVCSLSTFYEHVPAQVKDSPEYRDLSIKRLLGKLPTIAAYSYKRSIGQPLVYPLHALSYCGNFLNMMFSVPSEAYKVDPVVERALDQLLILHADHEQNCSAATVRMVGSSRANLFVAVSAGISALSGSLHGGANQQVLEMLQHIHDGGGSPKTFMEKCKDKDSHARLMGFGHRVYKNYDPRATAIKKICDQVLEGKGIHDPLLDIAISLEETALKDDYFVERKLYPNVDFYSGIIYRAIGLPTDMFTVLFAMGRMPGWIAQWKEMRDHNARIGRPRQVYTGANKRDYVVIEKR